MVTQSEESIMLMTPYTIRSHSERGQACRMRKTGNGTMKQREESIMLMTSYRFPHHGYRSFTFVQDDV